MGGHLATITTEEEEEWINRNFASQLPGGDLFFIGGFQESLDRP